MAGLVTLESIANPDKIFFQDRRINSLIARATAVDTEKKFVTLEDGSILPYDKLLIATGASPVIPSIEGRDLEGVLTLRDTSDALKIKNYLEEKNIKKLTVLGAGSIALELATLLRKTKSSLDITLIIRSRALRTALDPEFSTRVEEYLIEKGIKLKLGENVTRILGKEENVSGVELTSAEKLDTEMVIVSMGVKTNLELAESIGLEVGRFGIKVNPYMETSVPDVFAAGDCVEKECFITKKPVAGRTRSPAVIQGRLVAKRLAGYDIKFPGVFRSLAVKLFDKSIASVGLTEVGAQEEDIEPIGSTVDSSNIHKMLPGVKPFTMKLVFDKRNHKLIGGQIFGDSEMPVKEVDTLTALILGKATIFDLTTFMATGYPDLSSEPSREPIALAAEQALQKVKGTN
ncbi:MAG: FAD-dependent oxidoreductase [Thermodesulfobacteriota bacterium]|nr:FAD-dependent oxidoreductase [Thermodesulfobacteriota bacterium]